MNGIEVRYEKKYSPGQKFCHKTHRNEWTLFCTNPEKCPNSLETAKISSLFLVELSALLCRLDERRLGDEHAGGERQEGAPPAAVTSVHS